MRLNWPPERVMRMDAWARSWDDDAGPGAMLFVFGGIVVPILLTAYGLYSIVSQQVTMAGQVATIVFYGGSAVAIGVGFIAMAVLVHCAIFWDGLYGSTCAGARGKLACLTVMGICAYYICFRFFM